MTLPDPTKTFPNAPKSSLEDESHSTATGRETISFVQVSASEQAHPAQRVDTSSVIGEHSCSSASRYEIRRSLGSGAFGTVNLAWDHQLQREVAIKRPQASLSAVEKQSLLSEAQLAAKVRHPAVVVVHDVQVDDRGEPFIVYEYLPGNSLRQKIQTEKRLSIAQSLEMAITIAEGLAAAHKLGLTHRDLKPGNILLDEEGRPRIADFGMAIHEAEQHDLRGQVAGTQKYMSPEQVRGESHLLDGRTDLWALGIILYELLTGKHPFSGNQTVDVAEQILQRDPRPPRQWVQEIPPDVEAIVLKLLAKPLDKRYGSASEVADALHKSLTALELGSGTSQTNAPAPRRLILIAVQTLVTSIPAAFFLSIYWQDEATYLHTDYRSGVWTQLLDRNRGFGEILNTAESVNRFWSEDGRTLFVSSNQRALLQLGESSAKDFTLELAVKPSSERDDMGLLLGYGPDLARPDYDTCTLIGIEQNKKRATLVPRQLTLEKGGSQHLATLYQPPMSTQFIPQTIDGVYFIRIDVRRSQLKSLAINNNELVFPEFEIIRRLPVHGRFGVFSMSSSGSFSSFKIYAYPEESTR